MRMEGSGNTVLVLDVHLCVDEDGEEEDTGSDAIGHRSNEGIYLFIVRKTVHGILK